MIESSSERDEELVESEDVKKALAPVHQALLESGKALARCLDEPVVRTQLDAPEGIEPLRHELRHAPSLATATTAEIRCAVAILEFSLALEGWVFQGEGGLSKKVILKEGRLSEVVLSVDGALWIHFDDSRVPDDYLLERIANAISCNRQAGSKLFYMLLLLVKDQIISVPRFNTVKKLCSVELVHDGK